MAGSTVHGHLAPITRLRQRVDDGDCIVAKGLKDLIPIGRKSTTEAAMMTTWPR